jgi:tripartite ATP-independent transporter DctM subunit
LSPLIIFIIGLVLFLILAFLGMPIAFAFAIVGFAGFTFIRGIGPGLAMLGSAPWGWASKSDLIVVPLFILMGQFAFHSGISRDLFVAANRWIGKLPGGLALATNLACTGFAACTGSSLASGATMGTIAYPEMMKFNYSPRLATGSIASGGTLGILIPPSIVFIIYGFLTAQPIGVLFIAGIFPGLLLSGLFATLILVMCLRNPKLGPRGESFSWRERFASLTGVWGMLVLFVIVIGGLYFGVFAPSEAGAVGAFGALLVALSRRRTTIRMFITALIDSLRLTVMTMTILIGAMIFSVFVTVSGFPSVFSAWVTGLPISPIAVLLLILIIYIPLGMVLDALSMILLTIPTVFPIISGLGFDPIWFGVLIVLVVEMALITPPVGMIVYVVQGVTKVPLEEVFRGNMPFLIAMIAALALLVAFPQISLFLPSTM